MEVGHIQDLDEILELSRSCARKMNEMGIHQWHEDYPSREVFESDLEQKELYCYKEGNEIAGVITLNEKVDDSYHNINWKIESGKHLVVHRLAVHPKFQGRGIAKKIMDFAEQKAKNENYSSIKLDAYSLNEINLSFYKKRGYEKLGQIYLELKEPFYCFQLDLTSKNK